MTPEQREALESELLDLEFYLDEVRRLWGPYVASHDRLIAVKHQLATDTATEGTEA